MSIFTRICLALPFLVLAACDFNTKDVDIGGQLESLKRTISTQGTSAKSMASEEMQKLFTIEYKVLELDSEEPSEKVQLTLSDLGKERWDCYHVDSREKSVRVYCKRLPMSYVRMVTSRF